MLILSFVALLTFVAVHLFGNRLMFLSGIPRSRWLSAAGGTSVAYVFVHLLPELSHIANQSESLPFEHNAVWLTAMLGLIAFYGLECLAQRRGGTEQISRNLTFWLHLWGFALYNFLIAYFLVQEERLGASEFLLYAFAMAVHFLVTDHGLREQHKQKYHDRGRWLLITALVAGYLTGLLWTVPELMMFLLLSFLGGSVVMNVLKEELPEQRKSRYSSFLLGVLSYSAVMLYIGE